MADRAEHPERDSKADYKDSRDREPKEHHASRDYAAKDYASTRDHRDTARDRNNSHENKIYVGGLHYDATKEDIAKVFSKAGRVAHVVLVVDPETQRSKGYAFVTFASEEAYSYALNRMNGVDIMGRNVVVNKALNPEEKAQMDRERGTNRDREARHPPRPQHVDRPHFDKPPGPKWKGFRVTITGLPDTYTWRELKDFLRNTTDAQPTYANVDRPGLGVGEWASSKERDTALRLIDGMTLDGAHLRCEPLEEERAGLDSYGGGRSGSHARPERDQDYAARDERGRPGGGSYDDRYYSKPAYDGEGGGPRGGGYGDRYPDKYSSKGDGAGRVGSYDGPGRYDGAVGGPRYDPPGPSSRYEPPPHGAGGRYDSVGYAPRGDSRDVPKDGAGYSSREPGYGSRDPGYGARDGGGTRDAGGYGGYSSRNGGGAGGGYGPGGGYPGERDYPSGGRGAPAYEAPYPEKYTSRGGEYAGGGRGGDYPPSAGRSARYDVDDDGGPRREASYGPPPPRDPYSSRDPGYPPRDRPYPEPRGAPVGSGGREPVYDRGSGGYERPAGYDRGAAASGAYERGTPGGGYDRGAAAGGSGYERGGYERGAEHYAHDREGAYKPSGAGGGYGGSGRSPAAGPPPSSRGGGGYPPERYEGTGRGGPDRAYPASRGSGYERSAPY